MIPTPIQSALATLRLHHVETLLLGGQASILYGGAEFSRDLDLMLAAGAATLPNLERALADLDAELIAVPLLSAEALDRGHAVHFRCRRPDVAGLRLDLMTRPPRLEDLDGVWRRRVEIRLEGGSVAVVSLADLIATKRTQRDKDWAIIGALVRADMVRQSDSAAGHEQLWLRESRDADDLVALATTVRPVAKALEAERPLLGAALRGDRAGLELELAQEQIRGKQADRDYWAPLQMELERMRHAQRRLG